jgi:hypothetical protein
LNLYGREFPEFLSEHILSQEFPFLKDLAKFELCFQDVFHSEHNSQTKIDTTIRFLKYDYAIYELWKASREESPLEELVWDRKTFACMYKCDSQVFVKVLSESEFQAKNST